MNARKAQIRMHAHQSYISSIEPAGDRRLPNILLIFVDDMGHGDISCFGSEVLHTPHLDELAERGIQMTNFYASSPLCSPSRFSCLTGRYANRGFVHGVFFPSCRLVGRLANAYNFPYGVQGILPDEITMAEALQARGYATGIFGKWHLGDRSPHLPGEKGFDHFYGTYYSNDMKPYAYYQNEQVVLKPPVDQTTLTRRITAEILSFIEEHQDERFFLYYSSPFPHHPAHASSAFQGTSRGGTYGDCVEELDWSVGQIRKKLQDMGLLSNTVIVFTSDNGPWFEGSPGFHRGRKGNNFDGGQIVPMIASWPDGLPAGDKLEQAAMNIDLFPTIMDLAGIRLPADRTIDGRTLLPLWKGERNQPPHEELLFLDSDRVMAIRSRDNYKYVDRDRSENRVYWMDKQGPFLFNLNCDHDESYDLSGHYPDKAAEMADRLSSVRRKMKINPRGWYDDLSGH